MRGGHGVRGGHRVLSAPCVLGLGDIHSIDSHMLVARSPAFLLVQSLKFFVCG